MPAMLVFFVLVVALAPSFGAYPGGASIANHTYAEPTCHTKQSTSVMGMSASKTTLAPGETVSVTVTVTGGEASGAPLGVMLLSALSSDGSLPSDHGWTITSDPTGSTSFNYYQVSAYTGSLSATWTLTAPPTAGVYTLYAREVHGNGDTYTNQYSAGISFVVGSPGLPSPLAVIVTSPADGSTISGTFVVNANIVPADDISYVVLRMDGLVIENKSSPPFTWTIDSTRYADRQYTLNITAVNSTGAKGYEELTITIDNGGRTEEILQWMVTMGAGVVAIVAGLCVAIVAALLVRKIVMERKERREGKGGA